MTFEHGNLIYCLMKVVKFDGSCLKQDKPTFNHKTVVNICFCMRSVYGH